MATNKDSILVSPEDKKKFGCNICHDLLRDPVRDECEHLFCRRCLVEFQQKSSCCPITHAAIDQSFKPDPKIKEEVGNLKIKCPNEEDKCHWTGLFKDYPLHEKDCRKAAFSRCKNPRPPNSIVDPKYKFITICNALVPKGMFEEHKKSCPFREIKCELCDSGKLTDLAQKQNHWELNCRTFNFDCYFRNAGCQFKGNWDQISHHNIENFVSHAKLLESALVRFNKLKSKSEELIKEIQKDTKKYEKLQHYFEKLDNTEDIDFKVFRGEFDRRHSSTDLTFAPEENDLVVLTKKEASNSLLWVTRKFHQQTRFVFTIEKFPTDKSNSAPLMIGLAKKGELIFGKKYNFDKSNENKFILFKCKSSKSSDPMDVEVKTGDDFMLSYDQKEKKLYFESLDMKLDNPPELSVSFHGDFVDWQPVVVLSHDVQIRLSDCNEWNAY